MMVAEFMSACLGEVGLIGSVSVINSLRHDDTGWFIGDLMPYQPE